MGELGDVGVVQPDAAVACGVADAGGVLGSVQADLAGAATEVGQDGGKRGQDEGVRTVPGVGGLKQLGDVEGAVRGGRAAGSGGCGVGLHRYAAILTVVSLAATFIIGLLLAVFFDKHFRLSGLLRSLMLLPWLLPLIISAAV